MRYSIRRKTIIISLFISILFIVNTFIVFRNNVNAKEEKTGIKISVINNGGNNLIVQNSFFTNETIDLVYDNIISSNNTNNSLRNRNIENASINKINKKTTILKVNSKVEGKSINNISNRDTYINSNFIADKSKIENNISSNNTYENPGNLENGKEVNGPKSQENVLSGNESEPQKGAGQETKNELPTEVLNNINGNNEEPINNVKENVVKEEPIVSDEEKQNDNQNEVPVENVKEESRENYIIQDGNKINISPKVKETKTLGNIEISDIVIIYRNTGSYIYAKTKNVGETEIVGFSCEIVLLNDNGDKILSIYGYINKMKVNATGTLSASVSLDISNAHDIAFKRY